MYTQCRGCGEVFVIDVDHLTHARGHVRCNLCGTVFDGLETLSDGKPQEGEDLLLHDFDNAPPLLTKAYATTVADSVEEEIAIETAELPEFVTPEETQPFQTETPQVKTSGTNHMLWGGLSLVMLLSLFWQARAAIGSGQLQLEDSWLKTKACQYLTCAEEAPAAVDLGAISLVSRHIRPHPGRDHSLIISASMINANQTNQTFPALEIKLSNLDGEVVAMRRFRAQEYLPRELLKTGFVSNTLIPINLEILSPGEDAVAFEIGFAQP